MKRNSSKEQYDLPLKIISYDELYGWSMDEIVKAVGLKNNCKDPNPFPLATPFLSADSIFITSMPGTFCGVFRRQALDRGAALLGVKTIVTGHNADDIAETVLMNCNTFSFRALTCPLLWK